MPTVLYINEPAHIHVEKGDGTAKIWLEPELSPKYFYGFKTKEKKEILKIVSDNYEFLRRKWDEYFQE